MLVAGDLKSQPIPVPEGTSAGPDDPGLITIPAHIDAIAARCSAAVALTCESVCYTYGKLSDASDRLAADLANAGVGVETLVGMCLPRSLDRIVATLAVWKAGGAVLMLDPAWPLERLRLLLEDANATLVLATEALASVLSGTNRAAKWIDANSLTDGAGAEAAARGQTPFLPTADTLAYVVYTSGSTGEPKGVEITHRNVSHLIAWHKEAFAVSQNDRVSHIAGLGFDASFWEVWPALCSGAEVILADEKVRTSPDLLQCWLLEQSVTIAFVPTVLAEILVGVVWPCDTALRYLLTGGETLRRRLRPGLPFTLVNNYGPSECTVVATSGFVGLDNGAQGSPDIGWPITGTQIHLLNDFGEPVAEGEAGEIFIGGAGVGRGYRNRPDLTKQRFIQDRFQSTQGGRLYRSGDFGRYLPDGRIAFLGRNDEQEQIRGVRVEPAEVVGALGQHPMVQWCAVLGDGPAAARRLVAYMLPVPHAAPTAETLRAFLGTLLPEAMIPAVFIWITAVPFTANGKLDRAALPPPEMAMLLPHASFRAPATAAEARLSAIISVLLGGMTVGADDNFFLLGGHSLLGTQVVLRAQEAFEVRLSLRDLFQAPTVAGLAARVTELLAERLNEMTDEEAECWAAD